MDYSTAGDITRFNPERDRFLRAAENVLDAIYDLAGAWEAVELSGDETPSTIAGYPLGEDLGDVLSKTQEWLENVRVWSQGEAMTS